MDSIFFRPGQGMYNVFLPPTFAPAFVAAPLRVGPQPQLLALLQGLLGVSDQMHSTWQGVRYDLPPQPPLTSDGDWQAVADRWGLNVTAIDDAIHGGSGPIGVNRGPLALSPSGLGSAA
jgi:hypothetical protein